MRRSFVTCLRDKGYDTDAYYSWPGHFYNARRAYRNYGFDRFFDVEELGLERSGSSRMLWRGTAAGVSSAHIDERVHRVER